MASLVSTWETHTYIGKCVYKNVNLSQSTQKYKHISSFICICVLISQLSLNRTIPSSSSSSYPYNYQFLEESGDMEQDPVPDQIEYNFHVQLSVHDVEMFLLPVPVDNNELLVIIGRREDRTGNRIGPTWNCNNIYWERTKYVISISIVLTAERSMEEVDVELWVHCCRHDD